MEKSWVQLHQQAVAQALDFYKDPTTGFWVATELALKKQGKCCNSGCRHCPWTPEQKINQKKEKR